MGHAVGEVDLVVVLELLQAHVGEDGVQHLERLVRLQIAAVLLEPA